MSIRILIGDVITLVASGFGLDCTLIELNPDYAEIARERIASAQGPLFQNIEVAA